MYKKLILFYPFLIQCSRCRGREEEPRFVLGRYRHPTGRHPPGYHQHHLQEEEGIYETADHDRGADQLCGDTPDSGR